MRFVPFVRRAVSVVALAVLCTCGTLDRFDVDTTASATIPKKGLVEELLGVITFDEFEELDFSQEIANQGVREDQIDSVSLKSFVVSTEEGSGQTLDFIASIQFFAEAPGQPRVLIAESFDFAGKTSVELNVEVCADGSAGPPPDKCDKAELKLYVTATSMTIDAEVTGKSPDEDTIVNADVTLSIDATIPGCE